MRPPWCEAGSWDTVPDTRTGITENKVYIYTYAKKQEEEQEDPEEQKETENKISAFVNRCYSLILNRKADAAGLQDWEKQLENKTKTGSEIICGFMYSNEYIDRKMSSEETVKILYRIYMNREADPEGLAFWMAQLAEGMTLEEAVREFAASGEFNSILRNMKK